MGISSKIETNSSNNRIVGRAHRWAGFYGFLQKQFLPIHPEFTSMHEAVSEVLISGLIFSAKISGFSRSTMVRKYLKPALPNAGEAETF